MKLAGSEVRFLKELLLTGPRICKTNPPPSGIQSLVDRGYCGLSKARAGPLGVYTGEIFVYITEAGDEACFFDDIRRFGSDVG